MLYQLSYASPDRLASPACGLENSQQKWRTRWKISIQAAPRQARDAPSSVRDASGEPNAIIILEN